jgi:hypothetical protein
LRVFPPEEFNGADGLGAGLAGDLLVGFEVDAILADVLGAEQIGGFAVELVQLADTSVIGLFGAGADGQELEVIGEGF